MRRVLVMALLTLGWAGFAEAQAPKILHPPVFNPNARPQQPDGSPMWWGFGSAAGQAAIQACLDANRPDNQLERCMIPDDTCVSHRTHDSDDDGADPLDSTQGVRRCWWGPLEDWEKVMARTLAWLKAQGHGDLLEESQKKWEASMYADVGIYMDGTDGSFFGMLGARTRALLTARRVLFLEDLRAFDEVNFGDDPPARSDDR